MQEYYEIQYLFHGEWLTCERGNATQGWTGEARLADYRARSHDTAREHFGCKSAPLLVAQGRGRENQPIKSVSTS